jgi:hypothetical protein
MEIAVQIDPYENFRSDQLMKGMRNIRYHFMSASFFEFAQTQHIRLNGPLLRSRMPDDERHAPVLHRLGCAIHLELAGKIPVYLFRCKNFKEN